MSTVQDVRLCLLPHCRPSRVPESEDPPSPPGKPWSWQQPEISSGAAWPCRTCGSTNDGHQLSRPEQSGGSRSRLQDTSKDRVSRCQSFYPPPSFSLFRIGTHAEWCQKHMQHEESITWEKADFFFFYWFLAFQYQRDIERLYLRNWELGTAIFSMSKESISCQS